MKNFPKIVYGRSKRYFQKGLQNTARASCHYKLYLLFLEEKVMFLKILLLLIFFSVMIGVGFYSRRKAGNVTDYVLGGREVGPWITAFAYGTSYFSSVVFVGYAGQFGWKYGLSSTWIGLGNAFIGSLLAWLILGRRTRVMTQKLDSRTMPDFFGKRFQSKPPVQAPADRRQRHRFHFPGPLHRFDLQWSFPSVRNGL